MKKSLVTLGLALGILTVGGTTASAGVNSPDAFAASNPFNQPVSDYVVGKHQYGTWTINGVSAYLYENCGNGDRKVAEMINQGYYASNDYYMNGSCSYKITTFGGDGIATVSNYKR